MHRSCLFWISLILGLPIVLLVTYFGLNYSGFCFAQMRYLSKEEKIRAVFNYQNNRSILLKFVDNANPTEYIRYRNFEEFLAENPDCCHVNPGGPYEPSPTPLLSRILFGYDSGDMVVIDFKVRYIDEKGNRGSEEVQFENQVSNCGDKVH